MSVTAEVRFAIVPEWLLESDVSPQAIRVYAVLDRFANKDSKRATPGHRAIAERSRCSVATVKRAIAELATVGAVEVRARRAPEGDRTSNEYRLRVTPPQVVDDPTTAPERAHGQVTDDPTGRVAGERENESQVERESPEREVTLATAAPPRRRDLIFEALETAFGKAPTGKFRGPWNAATKALREAEATPEEIVDAVTWARRARDTSWRAATPTALASNLGTIRLLREGGVGEVDHASEMHAEAERLRAAGL